MVNHQKKIYVYENWSATWPNKIGMLYVGVSKRKKLGHWKDRKICTPKVSDFWSAYLPHRPLRLFFYRFKPDSLFFGILFGIRTDRGVDNKCMDFCGKL